MRASNGFLYDVDRYGDDRWVPIRDVELTSDYDDEWFPPKNHVTVTTDDHVYEVDGDVWSNIPLRNRREGMVTRITEGMTTLDVRRPRRRRPLGVPRPGRR